MGKLERLILMAIEGKRMTGAEVGDVSRFMRRYGHLAKRNTKPTYTLPVCFVIEQKVVYSSRLCFPRSALWALMLRKPALLAYLREDEDYAEPVAVVDSILARRAIDEALASRVKPRGLY